MKKVAIIGGGPAALMLAAQLDKKKYTVTLFEKNKAVARKFLVAGEGGLNLTFNAPLDELIEQYSPSEFMAPILGQFNNEDLMAWFEKQGVPTFVGSSNRVFPEMDYKPIEVLNKIVENLTESGVEFKLNTKWLGWTDEGQLLCEGADDLEFDYTVFALGGASWKVTGSDGAWSPTFEEKGIQVNPFRAANCAFGVEWNKNFIKTHRGKPLKNIAVSFDGKEAKGELVVTEFGLEGNAIYALSENIQNELLTKQSATVHLDLKPSMTVEQIKTKYTNSKLDKVTDILKEDINLDRTSIGLLKQFSDKETFLNPDLLAEAIKSIPVQIHAADELDNAISSLGGIALDEVDANFELKKMPNTFVVGEMLDWYAPTGGYLLQGCFSMGFVLAQKLNEI